MESVQTSLFQRFGADSELLARHWTRKPVPVKSNVNQDSGEGPATLASKPSCPVPTPCIHTVGSRPSVTANRRADKARPSLHGPARSDVESLSATSSHLKDRTSLTDPTTAAGSLRPPASNCASSSTGWDVLHPLPQTPTETTPFTAFPWPVRHRDSSGSRPHTWHRSRPHYGRIPLCRHWERFPSHRSPAMATRNPPHARPDSPPRTA